MVRLALAAALAASLRGCPGQRGASAPPSPPDASDAAPAKKDAAELACERLAGWHCPIGSDPNCAAAFRLPAKFGADPQCALTSTSAAEASRKCNVPCSGP